MVLLQKIWRASIFTFNRLKDWHILTPLPNPHTKNITFCAIRTGLYLSWPPHTENNLSRDSAPSAGELNTLNWNRAEHNYVPFKRSTAFKFHHRMWTVCQTITTCRLRTVDTAKFKLLLHPSHPTETSVDTANADDAAMEDDTWVNILWFYCNTESNPGKIEWYPVSGDQATGPIIHVAKYQVFGFGFKSPCHRVPLILDQCVTRSI